MKRSFRILGRRRREQVRDLTRESFVDNQGNPRAAEIDAVASIKSEFNSIIATILISIAIKLALALIAKWVRDRLSDPGVGPRDGFFTGEPGCD